MVLISSRVMLSLILIVLQLLTEKLENAGFKNYPIVLHGASSVDPDVIALCNSMVEMIKGVQRVFLTIC